MKLLEYQHELNYTLVNNGQSYPMKTLDDLKWYLFRCIDAKFGDGGPDKCLRLKWSCGSKFSDNEIRQIARFLKSRLIGRFKIETLVKTRDQKGIAEVRFINQTKQCKECEEKVDCLTSERL
jgi:hypothetical protein